MAQIHYSKKGAHIVPSAPPQKNNKNSEFRVKALLSMNRALWGEVSPDLRAAMISWNEEEVHLYFYYDGKISEEDNESAECISTEVIASFPKHRLEVDILRWDSPKLIPQGHAEMVYRRREP